MKTKTRQQEWVEETTKPKRSKKKGLKIAAIVILSLVLIFAGGLAALGIHVSNGSTLFPNITISGVSVGGLSIDEAANRLDLPMADETLERSVVLVFPGGGAFEISAQEAGLFLNGHDAAQVAYRFGRSGNIFANSISFLRAQFSTVHLDPFTQFTPDEYLIRRAVDQAAVELERQSNNFFEVVEDELVIVKGQLRVHFDQDRVTQLISQAFQTGASQPIEYYAQTENPEPIDLEEIFELIFVEPENAYFDIETEEVLPHTQGVSFNLALAQNLLNQADFGQQVHIPLVFTEPEWTKEFLEEVLFRDVLAQSTTRLTNDENRNTNVALAASFIDGMILNPGDQFDFNPVVGQRTAARGFRPGGAFMGTQVIQSIGGGICQVSSTIYHALLHTEIQVDVRINHTLVVTYLPLGMDAAVAWGGPNFSFTNNLDFPIRIVTYRDGLDFHVRIEGTNTSEYHRIVPEGVYINSVAYSTTYRDYPGLPRGETRVDSAGRIGHVVDVFQRFYDANGNLVRREFVQRSSYHAVPRVVLRGTGEPIELPPVEDPPPPQDPPPAPPPPDTDNPQAD